MNDMYYMLAGEKRGRKERQEESVHVLKSIISQRFFAA